MIKLFIDDIRDPPNTTFIVVRSSEEAIKYVLDNGCPRYISFDHDLGGDDTAMKFIHWLIDSEIKIPTDFTYSIHSQNPVGRENIRGLLNSYLKHLNLLDSLS